MQISCSKVTLLNNSALSILTVRLFIGIFELHSFNFNFHVNKFSFFYIIRAVNTFEYVYIHVRVLQSKHSITYLVKLDFFNPLS